MLNASSLWLVGGSCGALVAGVFLTKWLGTQRVGSRRSPTPTVHSKTDDYTVFERECTLLQQWYTDQPSQRLYALASSIEAKPLGLKNLRVKEYVEACVWSLIQGHPILSLTIARDPKSGRASVRYCQFNNDSSPPTNHPMGRMPVEIIPRKCKSTWHEVAQAWTHATMQEDQWLFRVAVIVPDGTADATNDVEIVIAMHHVIADGKQRLHNRVRNRAHHWPFIGLSSTILMRDLVTLLAYNAPGTPHRLVLTPEPLLLMDEWLDLRPTLSDVLSILPAELFPAWFKKKEVPFWQGPGTAGKGSVVPETHFTALTFPPDYLTALQAHAKHNHMTIHALLSAMTMLVTANIAGENSTTSVVNREKSTVPLKFAYPIGKAVRDLMQSSFPSAQDTTSHRRAADQGVGTFIASTEGLFDVPFTGDASTTSSISLPQMIATAKQFTTRFQDTKAIVRHSLDFLGLLAFLPRDSWAPWFIGEGQSYVGGHANSVELSNLGAIAFPAIQDEVDECHIRRVKNAWLVQGRGYRAPVLAITAVSIAQASLNVTVSCHVGVCGCCQAPSALVKPMETMKGSVTVSCPCVANGVMTKFCDRFIVAMDTLCSAPPSQPRA